ncbi:MAG: secretion protein HylD [Burkholderiales bacterium 28-67-8]|nr:MAG: secretion protein HylD [Burkholderiales bacterium 28-67-8]
MQLAVDDDGGLARQLAALLELGRRARMAGSPAELRFLLVNDSLLLSPYRQSALWSASRGIETLSGLVQPEVNAPYAQWLKALGQHLSQCHGAASSNVGFEAFTAADLPDELAREWAEWWPTHALWLPLAPNIASAPAATPALQTPSGEPAQTPSTDSAHVATAALLLARDEPWSESELTLLREWCATWQHAMASLQDSRRSGMWPFGRKKPGEPSARRWNTRRSWLIAAAALVGLSVFPVHLSVLAPGELVPSHPVVVRAPLDGVVDVFHVQPNEVVSKGQPLFGFDEALIQSRIEVAAQSLATAETEYRQTTQQALTDARSKPQLALLTGKIEERRADLDYLREQLGRARVLAPEGGVALFDDPAEWIGKPVTVGERILRIAAPSDVEVEAWLPIADAIDLPAGAPVRLYLNASPLSPVAAQLRYLAHDAVQRPDGSYAYRVRATLDEPTDHRVGLKGTAKLQGAWVPAIYWALRRPLATLRSTAGL